jgi:hypothetical protein
MTKNMTRTEAIEKLNNLAQSLPENRLELLVQISNSWKNPTTFYSLLSNDRKEKIEEAILRAQRGESKYFKNIIDKLRKITKKD